MRRLRSEGESFRQIAEKLGVGYGTVRLRLAQAGELITHRKTALLRPENYGFALPKLGELQATDFRSQFRSPASYNCLAQDWELRWEIRGNRERLSPLAGRAGSKNETAIFRRRASYCS
jgi:hypothetical protein